jgi:polyphenol oxidase
MNILDYVKIETSTVKDGNMSTSYGEKEEVIENRKNFFKEKGFEYDNTYLLRTDFKDFKKLDNVRIVGDIPEEFSMVDNTDGLITDSKDISLALLTADCLQITLFDFEHKVLSLVHAGFLWQNAGIIDIAISTLKETFSSKPEKILVHLGNCISAKHFRYDENILEKTEEDSWIRKSITKDTHPERPYVIDLRKAALLNLEDIGVLEENIEDTGIDCYTNKEYFSHVRSVFSDEKDGRHITLVQMK